MEGIRDLLRSTLRKSMSAASAEDRLAAAWPLVCGKAMATHGSVQGYEGEMVQIEVSDDLWLRQMKSVETRLVAGLAQVADVKVRGIHFKVR